ncbi:type I methionyl aminopeptidase [Actinacidiphila soli]|uniref:type I methionyl aminopeptidase n=1 Tax=Actinacidiphila soli TaxID=2487275 RepID=UPI0038992429
MKKAGVGARPVSILRSVSADTPAVAATSTMLRSPRASRSRAPKRSPRCRSCGLKGTPAVICASVNDAVVHGIPDDYRLRDGDLVSIDCGAELDGWTGDAAISFTVGTPRPADLELIAATQQALDAGIAAATVGHRIGDISHAISTVARKAACGMPADFGGHGIGRQMHEDPHVPNHGRPGRGFPLRHGLALAIEPMLMAGGRNDYRTDPDGWTLRTIDGSRAAHIEHTIAISQDGPRILTLP